MSHPPAYENWSSEPHARWIDAGNTFGWHLMCAARDYALKRISSHASPDARAAAEQSALDAIYGVMMLLDGVAPANSGNARVEYALLARVRTAGSSSPSEVLELAPNGDGLCMGFHGWRDGEFGT